MYHKVVVFFLTNLWRKMFNQLKVPESGVLLTFWETHVRKDATFESLFPFPAEQRVETVGFDWVTPNAHRLSCQYRNIERMPSVTLDVIVALALAQDEDWNIRKRGMMENAAFLCNVYINYFVVRGKDGLNHLVRVDSDYYSRNEMRDWKFVLADHTDTDYEDPSCARFYRFGQ